MSDKRDTGGSAFPQPDWVNPQNGQLQHYPGMTLRDYFAGQAIIALIRTQSHLYKNTYDLAVLAYGQADAMLEARK